MKFLELLQQFAPYCCFHKQEPDFPISFDTYASNSDLLAVNNDKQQILDNKFKLLLGKVEPVAIIDQWLNEQPEYEEQFRDSKLYLYPHAHRPGMNGDIDIETKNLRSLPTHAMVAEVSLDDNFGIPHNFYRLTYVFFYAKNRPEYAFGLGKHLSDLEHVAMYIPKNADGSWENYVEKMYFAAHSSLEAIWVNRQQIQYHEGHPVNLIARGSHGDHPSLRSTIKFFSSTYYLPRIFLFANDQFMTNGIKYQIQASDILPIPEIMTKDHEITMIGGPKINRDYINGIELPLSATPTLRQLPKKPALGSVTLWNPKSHAKKISHN